MFEGSLGYTPHLQRWSLLYLCRLTSLLSLSLNCCIPPSHQTLNERSKVGEQGFWFHLSSKSPGSSQGKSVACQNVILKGTSPLYAQSTSSLECFFGSLVHYKHELKKDNWAAKPCRIRMLTDQTEAELFSTEHVLNPDLAVALRSV